MMNSSKDITLEVHSGGMIAFEKTGIYPEFLQFNSKSLKRTWRLKLRKKNQQGVLKMNGLIVFKYFFNGSVCKMQCVDAGFVTGEWKIMQILITLSD